MDDLRAGLVAAGRAVSEAQQESEAVKKSCLQQEAAMASKYGTSIDVLTRLGEVTCVSPPALPDCTSPHAPACATCPVQCGPCCLLTPLPQLEARHQGLCNGGAEG